MASHGQDTHFLLKPLCCLAVMQIPSLVPRRGGGGGERAPGLHCSRMCLIMAKDHVAELGVCTNITINGSHE